MGTPNTALGLAGGLLANQTEGSRDAGNIFAQSPAATDALRQRATQGVDINAATSGVQNNGILGSIFGKGGTFQNTVNEENQLANQGFQLTPEDRTAYGQISGDIARQFGQSDQSLAQALSNRGLSNSGVAGAAFSGSQGSKLEQLAQSQQQIAQQRFQSNLQRLGQTRNFLTGLGQQAQGAIGQQLGAQHENQQQAMAYLGAQQNQSNTNLKQQVDTSHPSTMSNAIAGYGAGQAADVSALSGAGKAVTGMFG